MGSSSRPPGADYSLTAQADRIARALEILQELRESRVGDGRGYVPLVGGAPHDGALQPVDVGRLRKRLTTFEVDTVPGVGSYIQEERPDAVLEAIDKLQVRANRP